MREFKQEIKQTLTGLSLFWLTGSASLWLVGLTAWLPGFFIGCLVGAVHYIWLALRVGRAAALDPKKAAAVMRMGFILRFAFIVLALIAAAKASMSFFWSTVLGVLGLYAVQGLRLLHGLRKSV